MTSCGCSSSWWRPGATTSSQLSEAVPFTAKWITTSMIWMRQFCKWMNPRSFKWTIRSEIVGRAFIPITSRAYTKSRTKWEKVVWCLVRAQWLSSLNAKTSKKCLVQTLNLTLTKTTRLVLLTELRRKVNIKNLVVNNFKLMSRLLMRMLLNLLYHRIASSLLT